MNSFLSPAYFSVIGETFKLYWKNFIRMIAIVTVVEIIMALLGYGFVYLFVAWAFSAISIDLYIGLLVIYGLVVVLLIIVGYTLMEGAAIHAVSEQYFRKEVNILLDYRCAWKKFAALIAVSIISILAIVGLAITIIGIPLAIYLAVGWAFTIQIVLLEGKDTMAAFSRSLALIKNNWWRVFVLLLLLGLIAAGIGYVIGLIPVVGETIGAILTTPIILIGTTLLYFDLRAKKEGYNTKQLETELSVLHTDKQPIPTDIEELPDGIVDEPTETDTTA